MAETSANFSNPFRPPSTMTASAGARMRRWVDANKKYAGWALLVGPVLDFGTAALFFGYYVEKDCRIGRFGYSDGCVAGWVSAFLAISIVLGVVTAACVAYLAARVAQNRRRRKASRTFVDASLPFKAAYLRGTIDEEPYRALLDRIRTQRRDDGPEHGWLFSGQFLLRFSFLNFLMMAGSVAGAIAFFVILREERGTLPVFVTFLALAVITTILTGLSLVYGTGLRRAGARSRKALVKELRQLAKVLAQGGRVVASNTPAPAMAATPPPRMDMTDPWRAP